MAGITERKTNLKKPRNQTVANLDFLSASASTSSEPPTPGPSIVKVSDPSDTDDHEMDTTDESVSACGSFLFRIPFPLFFFSSKSDLVADAEITLVNKEDSEDGALDSPI